MLAVLPTALALCAAAPPAPPSPAPAPPSQPEPAGKASPSEDGGGAKPASIIEWEARIISGFEHERSRPAGAQTRPSESSYEFLVDQVRLEASGWLAEQFRFKTSFELSDALSPETGTSYSSPALLRTAVLEYRPDKSLRLSAGRFKRAFSKLELTSTSDLPMLERGLWNELALEDNQWGDRAIGFMAQGRVKPSKLRWYVGVTNPGWSSTLNIEGADVIGRLQISPWKALTLGVNGGFKYAEIGFDDSASGFAVGGDIGLELGNFSMLLEGSTAELLFETDRPRGYGLLLWLDYRVPLTADWALLPVTVAEIADANAEFSQTESLRLVFGVNVILYEDFRIMPELDLVRSLGNTSQLNPWLEGETFSLIFMLTL